MDNDTLITVYKLFSDIYHGIVIILTMILPLLEKAVVPLITVGGTLGGVYWAQKGQRETKEMELQHQKETTEQQFKREIIEKIFKGYAIEDGNVCMRIDGFNNFYEHQIDYIIVIEHLKKYLSDDSTFIHYSRLYVPHIYNYYRKNVYPLFYQIDALTVRLPQASLCPDKHEELMQLAEKYYAKSNHLIAMIQSEIKSISDLK